MTRSRRLSKSKYVAGLQCHRRLWWEVHEPDARELRPDPATQAIFDQGHRVGEHAQSCFPGGVLIDVPYTRPTARVEETARALATGAAVIFEAAFIADEILVAVDVLSRDRRGRFTLTEVKSTTSVKDVHLPDVAVQVHVVRREGLDVVRAEVMHLDRECHFPDLSNLFRRVDVTSEIAPHVTDVPGKARRQLQILNGDLPDVEPGEQCSAPYECAFFARCNTPVADDHVSRLYRLGAKKREGWAALGIDAIADLPDDAALTPLQERQRRAIFAQEIAVEAGLARTLEVLVPPIAYLDFETVAPAIPAWNGCGPYDAVPAQWSVHLQQADGSVEHHEWLAEGPEDPRPACATALAPVLARAKTIVAYNSSFERRAIEALAEAAPRARARLTASIARLVDLLPIVRDHVYHPDFGGSFSLKSVAPALVRAAAYDDLEVADGGTAASKLGRLLLDREMSSSERDSVREQLLAYCARDTEAMVLVVDRLRALARPSTPP